METTTKVGSVAFPVWRIGADGSLAWVGEVQAAPGGSIRGAVSFYDVTDPNRPQHFGEVQPDESGALSFQAEGAGRRFLIAGTGDLVTPARVAPRYASSLLSTDIEADYVIIAASHLVETAQTLAGHREADGYRVLVADAEDIFWELARILENVRAFENGQESLGTLFAGDDSERSEFAAAAGLLAQWAPPSRVQELDLNVEALEEARDRLRSNHVDTDALRTAFTEVAFRSDAETLGDAILHGHRAAQDAPVQLHRVYTLLGDLALRLRRPKAVPNPRSPSVGEPPQIDDPSRTGEASSEGSSGCEIGPKGRGQSEVGTWLLVLGFVLLIRRRRRRD